MLIVPQFCRPNESTSPAVAAMTAGCGPVAAAATMGALLLLSILYFSYLPWWHLCVPGAAVLAAIGGGVAFCRIAGGLQRGALLAANALTQVVFLFAYGIAQQF